jgi:hypothetical protein
VTVFAASVAVPAAKVGGVAKGVLGSALSGIRNRLGTFLRGGEAAIVDEGPWAAARAARNELMAAMENLSNSKRPAVFTAATDETGTNSYHSITGVIDAEAAGALEKPHGLFAEPMGFRRLEPGGPRVPVMIEVCKDCQGLLSQKQFPPRTPYQRGGPWDSNE